MQEVLLLPALFYTLFIKVKGKNLKLQIGNNPKLRHNLIFFCVLPAALEAF